VMGVAKRFGQGSAQAARGAGDQCSFLCHGRDMRGGMRGVKGALGRAGGQGVPVVRLLSGVA
jgi:hypothetical protein